MNAFTRPCFLLFTVVVGIVCSLARPAAAQLVTKIVPDGKVHKFEARDKQFMIDGQATLIVAGEMHFGRVLPEDFELRIKQAKAMGLNTVSFYLFWNLCEPQEGKFDFTGVNDVRRMLKLCQENGLWVILRPGPYCCAEVEYGALPAWTLKYPDVKIRTDDAKFIGWCRRYIDEVYKQVADLQVTKGGPLVMVQIDNEYGIVERQSNAYMVALHKVFKDVGFDVQLFTCDPGGTSEWTNANMRLPGVLIGRNGLRNARDAQGTAAAIGDFPIFSPEVYTAWFSGWGGKIEKREPTETRQIPWTTFLLDNKHSFCFYMFFGGTNWGYNTGCNEYLPVQTSYDYEAPVDEAGRATDKYRALRKLLIDKLGINPPAIPADPLVVELPRFKLDQRQPLLEWLPAKPTRVSAKPIGMEDLDQNYGFVLYRKKFPDGLKGSLELKDARDYAVVMVNGKSIGRSFIGYGPESNKIAVNESGPVTLDILIHNLGRISVLLSSRSQSRAHKGLVGGAFLDGKELADWEMYSLPLDKVDNFKASSTAHTGPTLYRGTFNVDQPASTFLDMRNWGMGVVWVNGHNLGRYWDRGALRSLFVSSHFLKRGENEVILLELHDAPKTAEVSGATKIIEEPAVPFVMKLDTSNPTPQAGGRR